MQSSNSCDVILDPETMKFFEVDKLGAGFYMSRNGFSSVKNIN